MQLNILKKISNYFFIRNNKFFYSKNNKITARIMNDVLVIQNVLMVPPKKIDTEPPILLLVGKTTHAEQRFLF
jgi:hypothetical protein